MINLKLTKSAYNKGKNISKKKNAIRLIYNNKKLVEKMKKKKVLEF